MKHNFLISYDASSLKFMTDVCLDFSVLAVCLQQLIRQAGSIQNITVHQLRDS